MMEVEMDAVILDELRNAIRDIPDFPKKGIIFKDITTLIGNGDLFRKAIDAFAEKYQDKGIELIACIDARGFIFGGALAYRLGIGVIPIRKKGKLPFKTKTASYELEYGTDILEVHEDAIKTGEKVLLIDDLLATGGTAQATAELIKSLGGDLVSIAFLIELEFLKGRDKIKDCDVFSLIKF